VFKVFAAPPHPAYLRKMNGSRQEADLTTLHGDVAGRRRFVLLRHEVASSEPGATHWDLMIDDGSSLRTWRLNRCPTTNEILEAEPIADHRRAYLEFQGELSGDRGRVVRIDSGWILASAWTPDRIRGWLDGQLLRGLVYLTRLDSRNSWSFEIREKRESESCSNS
jgi:hypothetical protein